MKRIIILALSSAVLVLLASACGGRSVRKAEQARADSLSLAEQVLADSLAAVEKEQKAMEKLSTLPEEPEFDIITTLGTMRVKLYSATPKHRDNFAKLAFSGFYDGLLFHRVIDGFMIQGGDPLTADEANRAIFGTGGPGYNVPAEIIPGMHHKKGALAAARRGDAANPMRESSGSQFYIVQNETSCSQLDGQYTVYGETVSGLEVIDKIARVERDRRDCPITPVKIVTIKLAE